MFSEHTFIYGLWKEQQPELELNITWTRFKQKKKLGAWQKQIIALNSWVLSPFELSSTFPPSAAQLKLQPQDCLSRKTLRVVRQESGAAGWSQSCRSSSPAGRSQTPAPRLRTVTSCFHRVPNPLFPSTTRLFLNLCSWFYSQLQDQDATCSSGRVKFKLQAPWETSLLIPVWTVCKTL